MSKDRMIRLSNRHQFSAMVWTITKTICASEPAWWFAPLQGDSGGATRISSALGVATPWCVEVRWVWVGLWV